MLRQRDPALGQGHHSGLADGKCEVQTDHDFQKFQGFLGNATRLCGLEISNELLVQKENRVCRQEPVAKMRPSTQCQHAPSFRQTSVTEVVHR